MPQYEPAAENPEVEKTKEIIDISKGLAKGFVSIWSSFAGNEDEKDTLCNMIDSFARDMKNKLDNQNNYKK